MKNTKIAVASFAVLVGLSSFAGVASAKGCLAGAAVGGAAGHFAGHHSIIGAGVGCAIGRHRANKRDRQAAEQARMQQRAPAAPVQPVNNRYNEPVRR